MDECKVGIYIRVSRDSDYLDFDSLENQLSLINYYCMDHNLNIVDTYIDDEISGTTFNRFGFKK